MRQPSRQALIIGFVLLVAGAYLLAVAARSTRHVVDAGFWFEPVTFDTSEPMAERLGGAITSDEMKTIASIAFSEIEGAFAGLRIAFSDRRDARFRVRVVQELRSAGESRALAGLGGQGALGFRVLVINAILHAPADADRPAIIAGIGRGIGRAAVHEFTHQLLGGTARIHDTKDIGSYEYGSADRREQYYGPMHWDIAWPMLQERIGP